MDKRHDPPIVVSKNGSAIMDMTMTRPEGVKDTAELNNHHMQHALCLSDIERREISPTHSVLCCKGCFARWEIPNTVKTYGDLRKQFPDFN